MALSLHDRRRVVSPAPASVSALIERLYAGSSLDEGERGSVHAFLNDARDRGQWLACDCRAAADPPPLLSIRRTAGSVALVRHGETPHAATCPFFRDPAEIQDRSERADQSESPVLPFDGSLAVLKECSSVRQGRSSSEGSGSPDPQRVSTPRLGRILLTLLHKAGLDRVRANEIRSRRDLPPVALDPSAQYGKLTPLWAQSFAGELRLGDVTCRFPSRTAAYLARFRALEARFPPGTRPQGYVMFAVDGWEPRKGQPDVIYTHTKRGDFEFEVHGPVRQFGQGGSEGPFFLIGQVAKVASTGRYEIVGAYLHPVYSKTLPLPVDSGLERHVAGVLMNQLNYWQWKYKLDVELHKPLFDQRGPNAAWVRPDFELHTPSGRRLVVEVIGYADNSGYLARKELLRSLLEGRKDVIRVVDWGRDTDPGQMRKLTTGIILHEEQVPAPEMAD